VKNELAVGIVKQVIIKIQFIHIIVDVFIFKGQERGFRVFDFSESKGGFHGFEK
jgi:hypothetical protein